MAESEQIDDENNEDTRVDVWAALTVFTALVAMAVYYVSGWIPLA